MSDNKEKMISELWNLYWKEKKRREDAEDALVQATNQLSYFPFVDENVMNKISNHFSKYIQ